MAAPVKAEIVLAQAGNAPPAGYLSGGRDKLVVGGLVTATNRLNTGVKGYRWKVTPCAGVPLASYGVAGIESDTLTLTPPSPSGFGDVGLSLTVYGDPLADGSANVSTDTIILGLRAALSAYAPGLPLPNEIETSAGGRATLSEPGGRERRWQETAYGLVKQVLAGGGGGGSGLTGITENGNAGSLMTGPVINFQSSPGIDLSGGGGSNEVAIGLDYSATIRSIKAFGQPAIYGDAALAAGNGLTLGQVGSTITANASRFRAGAAGTGTYFFGEISLIPSTGITIVPDATGKTFTFACTVTQFSLPVGYSIEENGLNVERKLTSSSATRGLIDTLFAATSADAKAATIRGRATSSDGLDEEVFRWGVNVGFQVAKRFRIGTDTRYQFTETFGLTTTAAVGSATPFLTFTPANASVVAVTIEATCKFTGGGSGQVVRKAIFSKSSGGVVAQEYLDTTGGIPGADSGIGATMTPSSGAIQMRVGSVCGLSTETWTVNLGISYVG